MKYLYQELASTLQAIHNCEKSNNTEWKQKHLNTLGSLVREYMPGGSGFDSGTDLDSSASHAEKLVFTTSFHHMDEMGGYDGWTEHTITVTPSFSGVNIRISGRNRNDIKEYIHETFYNALMTKVRTDETNEVRK